MKIQQEQVRLDRQGILLSSAKACCTSMLAHRPLTTKQEKRLEVLYKALLQLSQEVQETNLETADKYHDWKGLIY